MQKTGLETVDMFSTTDSGCTKAVPTSSVSLKIRGVDNITSFKNSKEIIQLPIKGSAKCDKCGKRPGRPMLITKKERKQQMESITASFESQLRSALATSGIATTTAPIPLSKIASLLPLDDSRKWIPEHCVSTLLVAKGDEGADVMIERIK